MNKKMNEKGMSIIEILIYVAILAVIGVVLSGYFVAAVSTQAEHDRRDDLANAAQHITAAFRNDVAAATQLQSPAIGATSSALVLMTNSGAVSFQQNGAVLNRNSASGTTALTDQKVHLLQLLFTGSAYVEPRLLATTTSVQYHVLLEHDGVSGLTRSVDGTLLIGKDRL